MLCNIDQRYTRFNLRHSGKKLVEPVSQNMKSSQDGFRRQGEARGGLLVALGDAYECVLQLEYLYTHYYSDVTNHLKYIFEKIAILNYKPVFTQIWFSRVILTIY